MSGPTSTFHEVAEIGFDRVAIQIDGEEEKMLHEPGVEGLHMFLEGCRKDASPDDVDAEIVSVESLKRVFEEKGWPENMSFMRENLTNLIEALGIPSVEKEELALDIAELVDRIHDRAETKEFPLVCPKDLVNKDEQGMAEDSLELAGMIKDSVKLQSYIEAKRQEYFANSPGDPNLSAKEKEARWSLEFYYKHTRDFFVVTVSTREGLCTSIPDQIFFP